DRSETFPASDIADYGRRASIRAERLVPGSALAPRRMGCVGATLFNRATRATKSRSSSLVAAFAASEVRRAGRQICEFHCAAFLRVKVAPPALRLPAVRHRPKLRSGEAAARSGVRSRHWQNAANAHSSRRNDLVPAMGT